MTREAPVIRAVRPADYETVGDLTLAAYQGLAGFTNTGGYEDELKDVASRVQGAEVFVALLGDEIVGGITFVADSASPLSEWDDAGAAGVRMLAISPEHQGKGLGRALTAFTIDRARDLGKARLLLHSTDFMHSAHRLYETMGFVRAPELDFSVEVVSLIGYRLEL